ncbi:hypothetical protein D4764_01G0019710 [Takifugu flavidus]|uniref:Uncharacterized protein n=1 Tax=Takifugu flavidus TaxID=433684 RepID=A0A5C6PT35_9TELE|nr:hypothetical protein D4764_01G0019710 [Takifugu flavidus]
MKPPCSDDLIAYLNEYIWERVKDEDICITDDSFKKMDNKIQKILRKELGNPNKVLFLLKYSEEPVVADCMVTILRRVRWSAVRREAPGYLNGACPCLRHAYVGDPGTDLGYSGEIVSLGWPENTMKFP